MYRPQGAAGAHVFAAAAAVAPVPVGLCTGSPSLAFMPGSLKTARTILNKELIDILNRGQDGNFALLPAHAIMLHVHSAP